MIRSKFKLIQIPGKVLCKVINDLLCPGNNEIFVIKMIQKHSKTDIIGHFVIFLQQ